MAKLTAKEITFIQKNADNMTLTEMSNYLGHPRSTVFHHFRKYRNMNVTKRNLVDNWSKNGKKQAITSKVKSIKCASDIFEKYKLDSFFLQGLALYWAEGTKKRIQLANTDWRVILFITKWYKNYIISELGGDLRYNLQIKDGNKNIDALTFWADALKIDKGLLKAFQKSSNSRSEYGVLSLGVTNTGLRNIQAFVEELLESYAELIINNL